MPKRKITPELWEAAAAAYEAWDPANDRRTIEEVLVPFGISKQAFYAERRRRGITGARLTQSPASDQAVVEVLLSALVEARVKIAALEAQIQQSSTSR